MTVLATLISAAVVALLVTVALAGLYALTVVPFVLALGLAERRGCSTGRWGAFAIGGVLLAVALALLAHLGDAPRPLQALPLVLAFAAPLALAVLPGTRALGGRAGRHERPL